MSDTVAADQLRLFIERIERLEGERKGIADDIRDVYLEANTGALRLRHQDDAGDRSPAPDGEARPRRSGGAARNLQSRAGAGLMRDRDTRPVYSPMPEHLAAVYDRHGMAEGQLVLAVFRDALAAGAGRPPAERENDAFSLAAQVVSIGLLGLAAEMSERKQVPEEASAEVLLRDVAERVRLNLQLMRAAADAKGATWQ